MIIARKKEIQLLETSLQKLGAKFIALYGRRRIGKTFLIRSLFSKQKNYLEITGLKDGALTEQLQNFTEAFSGKYYNNAALQPPKNWKSAFSLLTTELQKIPSSEKIILFFDELPWLATKKSGFMMQLDHVWNTKWCLMPNLMLVVCGSAAAWMTEHLINAKGGLHNRLTKTILLEPFTLGETELYLISKNIKLKRKQIFELYMAIGGVPHYLNEVVKGKSAAENIGQICFEKNGLLRDEFPKLFRSLFDAAEINLRIVKMIAQSRYGISRNDLLAALDLKTGGTFNKRLAELEAAGFIQSFVPYGKKNKDHYFRVIDEYTLFYLKWIEPITQRGQKIDGASYWLQKSRTPTYHSWAGYTFESVCLKHVNFIKKALELDKLSCETASFRYVPSKQSKTQGAQIDLLFDRDDGVITVCEIKYAAEKFKIDKAYGKILAQKIEVFENHFKTKKQIFMSMITTFGLEESIWSQELINKTITMDALFEIDN